MLVNMVIMPNRIGSGKDSAAAQPSRPRQIHSTDSPNRHRRRVIAVQPLSGVMVAQSGCAPGAVGGLGDSWLDMRDCAWRGEREAGQRQHTSTGRQALYKTSLPDPCRSLSLSLEAAI